jgi:hypothetical protein
MEFNEEIKCPSCNKNIKKIAHLCIHCGVNLKSQYGEKTNSDKRIVNPTSEISMPLKNGDKQKTFNFSNFKLDFLDCFYIVLIIFVSAVIILNGTDLFNTQKDEFYYLTQRWVIENDVVNNKLLKLLGFLLGSLGIFFIFITSVILSITFLIYIFRHIDKKFSDTSVDCENCGHMVHYDSNDCKNCGKIIDKPGFFSYLVALISINSSFLFFDLLISFTTKP